MKDGGNYLQSDHSGNLFQGFAKRQLVAMPRREVAARPDDCDLSIGFLFSRKRLRSLNSQPRRTRSRQLILLSLDVIAGRDVALLARDRNW